MKTNLVYSYLSNNTAQKQTKKNNVCRNIAAQFAKVEVHSGSSTLFWYDSWSLHGRLIEKTQGRGDMGIQLNDTVEKVVNSHRRRRRRGAICNLIEEEIHNLRTRGLDERDNTRLWKAGENLYKESFSSKKLGDLLEQPTQRSNGTEVSGFNSTLQNTSSWLG